MQIIRSIQIVTGVTSVVPTFLSCIALFDLLVLLGFTVILAVGIPFSRLILPTAEYLTKYMRNNAMQEGFACFFFFK